MRKKRVTFGTGESLGTESPNMRVCLQALATFGGRVEGEEKRNYFPLKEWQPHFCLALTELRD